VSSRIDDVDVLEAGAKDDRPASFFEEAHDAFVKATEAAGGAIKQSFEIAGWHVVLQFAGQAMVSPMTKALAHLSSAPATEPDLTICIWDSTSTGTPMARPAWSTDSYGAQGLINGFNTQRFQTIVQLANNTLNMLDHEKDMALYWIPDAERVTYYETISPLRTLMSWWMRRHGRQLAHAAVLGGPEGGVLLPAKGGSGKSTTALVCLEAGLSYVGDNNVLIGTDSSSTRAYSLYNSVALNEDNLNERFTHLRPIIENSEHLSEQKAFAFLHKRYPDQLGKSLPIRGVFIPHVTGQRDTRLESCTAAVGLNALVPSTVLSLPGAGRETIEALSRATSSLPHCRLMLGTDTDQIPQVISNWLRSAQ
jgi:hypothetical protein